MRRLDDRRVILTGATGGLGTAIAERLVAECGHACAKLAAQLGGDTLPVQLDVTDEDAWRAVVLAVREHWGAADVLVNNAGIGSLGTVETETRERWDQVVDIDQLGTWLGMKHVGAEIERSGGGAIVNIASISGVVPGPNQGVYSITNAAVIGMT